MPPRERDHERVARDLRRLIADGTLNPGDQLPSISEIADQYGVTQSAANRAVDILKSRGLVEARHGRGTYVRQFRPIRRSSPKRLAHSQWGQGHAIQDADTAGRGRSVVTDSGITAAPGWAAAALGIAEGAPAAYRRRQFEVDDRPVQLSTSWLPTDLVQGTTILAVSVGPGGTYRQLEAVGHGPVRFTEFVRARMPGDEEEERLFLPPGTPVLEVTRHAFDADDRCVEVNRMILDGMAYLLDYTFDA